MSDVATADLKLLAVDAEDLEVLSAHVQDAVLMAGDIHWRANERRVVVAMNRYAWERADAAAHGERRRSALRLDHVASVKAQGIRPDHPAVVLELLALRWEETQAPAGHVELIFAGGGTLRVEVDCLEATLTDLGAAWATDHCPAHEG